MARAGIWVGMLCVLWGLFPVNGMAQVKKSKVNILNSDNFSMDTQNSLRKFIGNVHMKHDDVLMWCDSLYQVERPDTNYLEAFGHVRVIKNDSIHMTGDYMYYDSNKKMIQVRRNVTLKDPQITLKTNYLDYDGIFDIGYYFNLSLIHI